MGILRNACHLQASITSIEKGQWIKGADVKIVSGIRIVIYRGLAKDHIIRNLFVYAGMPKWRSGIEAIGS